MTLAAIFLLGIFWSAAPPPVIASVCPSAQSASSRNQSEPQNSAEGQSQNPPAAAKPSAASPGKSNSPQGKKAPAKRSPHKKKAKKTCSPDASGSAPASVSGDESSAEKAAGKKSGTATAPTNHPPKKTIVRQGGTSDPSIQLAGRPSESQANQERTTTDEMLDSTEENLKKIAERQLTSTEQDMVKQIRQFAQQSKSALAAGDMERARTLAWKARTLSQDLVNPK